MTREARRENWKMKRQDSMILSCSREEKLTKGAVHETSRMRGRYYMGSVEESGGKNANMAMDVPIEEDYDQQLTKA